MLFLLRFFGAAPALEFRRPFAAKEGHEHKDGGSPAAGTTTLSRVERLDAAAHDLE
jgi:hypothetical protein